MKKVAGIVIAVLVLMAGAPFLIPTGAYLERIEKIASDKLGQPVTAGSLHFALLPTPRAHLDHLAVGAHKELQVERITVVPQIGSLLSGDKVISLVAATRPVLQPAVMDWFGAMPKSENVPSPSMVELRRVQIRDARLDWPGFRLPGFDADFELEAGNKLKAVNLESTDDRLQLEAVPDGEAYKLSLTAHQWTPPVGPPLLFNAMKSEMSIRGSQLEMTALEAELYQGTLSASATLDWSRGLKTKGKFRTEGMQVGEIAKLFGGDGMITGRLRGEGVFQAAASDATALADQLVLDYRFDIAKGVLHGIDLAKAATLLIHEGSKGGETKFDVIHGALHTQGRHVDLRHFKVASGLLEANGNVRMSPAKQLDGKIDVELKKGVALVTVPLRVSGNLDQPRIMPTKAALAGAAIGTGVLGPGLGTSLGVKAASGVEKIKGLFGGKP